MPLPSKVTPALFMAARTESRLVAGPHAPEASSLYCQNCTASRLPPVPGWLPPPPPANAVDATTPPAPSVAIAATAATPAFIIFLPKFM